MATVSEDCNLQIAGVATKDLEHRIDLYSSHLLHNVDGKQVLPYLADMVDRDTKQRIIETQTTKESMELLMKYLKKSLEPHCWLRFLEALHHANYSDIRNIIRGEDMLKADLVDQERILNIFTGELCDRINALDVIPYLCQDGVLTDRDKQIIEAKHSQYGRSRATLELLDRIPRCNKHWFELFIKALENIGHHALANDINPGRIDRISDETESDDEFVDASEELHFRVQTAEMNYQDHSLTQEKEEMFTCAKQMEGYQKEIDAEDSLKTIENHISMDGPSQISANNLGAPQPSSIVSNNLNEPNSSLQKEHEIVRKTKEDVKKITNELKKAGIDVQNFQGFDVTRENRTMNSSFSDDDFNSLDDEITTEKRLVQKREEKNTGLLSSCSNPTLESFEKIREEHHQKMGLANKMNLTLDEPPSKNQEYPTEIVELKLRSYQKDLAQPALQGKNCIIVAPTGSGKTFVAMKIIDEHFKSKSRKRYPKVIFLTEQGALAQQQGDQIEKYLNYKVKVITGESQRTESFSSIREWVERREILVVTAQLLVNALIEHDVEVEDFSLIVFDECHHAHAKHSYNQIMFHYLNLKLNENHHAVLPQIIGLTASVGVGKAKKLDNAVEWIKSMMANLDAEEICTVSVENERELRKHAQVPKETLIEVPNRKRDTFRSVVESMMQDTEDMMKTSEYLKLVNDQDKVTKPPTLKGSEQYIQWISDLRRETAKVRDQEAHRFFLTCRNYLDMFNKTLMMYDYARVKDAIELLRNELRAWQMGDKHDATEIKMKQYLDKCLPVLGECKDEDNPKLAKLKESIDKAFVADEQSRGIIFVKTRDLVKAIVSWMKDIRGLKELKPAAFVGTHAPGEEGLTKAEQDDILKLFREGGHKIIVATSVADEGLDIQECNLVIKYHQVTNEIAMVQRRGRARQKDSKVILFHQAGSGTAEKEELNMLREVMMNKAIEVLRNSMNNREQFMEDIISIQKRDKAKRELEAKSRNGRIQREGDFDLNCGKCREYICMSSDIRLIQGAHHAAVCDDIHERIHCFINPVPAYADKKLKSGAGRVLCKHCDYEIGNVSVYDNAQFIILKIANFCVKDLRGNYDTFKRWKMVPFSVRDITDEEVEERLKGDKYIELI